MYLVAGTALMGLVLLSGCQALHSETRLQYVSRLHRDIFKGTQSHKFNIIIIATYTYTFPF